MKKLKIAIGVIPMLLCIPLVSLLSCNKNYSQDPLVESKTNADTIHTAPLALVSRNTNIIYEETVEGSSPFSTADAIENCAMPWTFQIVSDPVFQGSKSVRFEIRKDQPLVGSADKIRSEVSIIKGSDDPRFTREMWYSYSLYFPNTGMEYDATRDCITQWYEDGSGETTVRVEKNKVYLEVYRPSGSYTFKKYDLFHPSSTSPGGSSKSSTSAFVSIPKQSWHQFIFHFIHSTGLDGKIQIWRDGVKIHSISGPNMHLQYPKWKFGLYKASFLDQTSTRYSRVIYFDNIRVGNSHASLAQMTAP